MAGVASSRARWGRRALLIFGAVVGVLALTYASLFFLTGRSQWARVFVWHDADVGDINRFPSRVIEASAAPSELRVALDGSMDQAFSMLDAHSGGGLADMVGNGADLDGFLSKTNTTSLLVVRHGELVYEWYGDGVDRETLQTCSSVSKSFLSTLIGLAIDQGYIGSLDDPITDYVPELLERDERFSSVTLKNLITMSSGLAYDDAHTPWSDAPKTYYAPDLRASALSAKAETAPSQTFLYNNYNPLLLGMALERATGQRVTDYMSQVLWKPMGAEADASWRLDSVNSAIDFARFGLMFLSDGAVDGEQVIPQQWVKDATAVDTSGDPSDSYQYFWWIYPPDARSQGTVADFAAQGNLGQYIYVIPDEDTVLVRLGKNDGDVAWTWILGTLGRAMGAADGPGDAPSDEFEYGAAPS